MSNNITPQDNGAERKLKVMRIYTYVAFSLYIVVIITARALNIWLTDHMIEAMFFFLIPYAITTYYEGRWVDDPSLSRYSRRSASVRVTSFIIFAVMCTTIRFWRFDLIDSLLMLAAFASILLGPYFLGRLVARRRVEQV